MEFKIILFHYNLHSTSLHKQTKNNINKKNNKQFCIILSSNFKRIWIFTAQSIIFLENLDPKAKSSGPTHAP